MLELCGVGLPVSCGVRAAADQIVKSNVALAAGYWRLDAWVVGR